MRNVRLYTYVLLQPNPSYMDFFKLLFFHLLFFLFEKRKKEEIHVGWVGQQEYRDVQLEVGKLSDYHPPKTYRPPTNHL
jgi:hypothetical protein